MEHLNAKYTGSGHADITKHEWLVNQSRDTLSTYISHHSILAYNSVVENESLGRLKYNYMQKMIKPCGNAPIKSD